jgi:hypothetical protein
MEIYYTSTYTDEENRRWFAINGDTHYDLDSGWTEEAARADYESPEHAAEDYMATMRAFGAYED